MFKWYLIYLFLMLMLQSFTFLKKCANDKHAIEITVIWLEMDI